MSIFKLKPACKDYLWGGERLKKEYGIEYDGDPLAEAWVLSCHPDGLSVIENGEYAGTTLKEYLEKNEKIREFPVLIKLIDAKQDLSIQVHPDDEYAMSHEGQKGKTEMWYVLDAAPNAFIYYGFKKEISKDEFEQRIRENTLLEVLNKVYVNKGDVYFIRPGTLHAIGAGCLIAEVQQNSNVTYRIYDYEKLGADGKKRELHIDKALDVTNRRPPEPYTADGDHLVSCEYFTTGLLRVEEGKIQKITGINDSFRHLLIISGSCTVTDGKDTLLLNKGDSVILTAGTGEVNISGNAEILETQWT